MALVFSPIKAITAEDFKRVTEVTYLGYVYGSLAALKHILPKDRGTIVHVGSALAYRSIPLQAAYCAAKHAVLGFFASLRTELKHDHSKVRTVMVQMPALNTPQFGWVKSRLPRKAQPVPPIFQPEVAARAIYYAAHHPDRREYYVAWSTVKAIFGNKLVPSRGDDYLARTGYDSQQHGGREDPNRPNNLWEPVAGDHGAHGAALVNEQLPIVVLAAHDSRDLDSTLRYRRSVSNIREFIDREIPVLSIVPQSDREIEKIAPCVLRVPDVPLLLQPILEVIPLQSWRIT